MRRIKRPALLLAAMLAVPGAAVSIPAAAAEGTAPLAVEAFAYPGAAKILAEQNLTVKTGDGNIRLADCASESGLVRIVRQVASPFEVCFKVTGPSGYLALETSNVINIKGDSHAIKATLSSEGVTSSVDIKKNDWTPVGQADNSTGNKPAVLLELVAGDGPAAAAPTTEFPAVGSLSVGAPGRAGSRGCTGTLIDPLWVLTTASCFTDDPSTFTPGVPAAGSTFTLGGRSNPIIEAYSLGTGRDAVIAQLTVPVYAIAPAKTATAAVAAGTTVKVAGAGRTATTWWSGVRTTDQSVGTVSASTVDLSSAAGAAPLCAGDNGAPLFNAAGEITALVSRAWQGGCLETPASETRTGASATRVEGIASAITTAKAGNGRTLQTGTKLTSGASIIGLDLKLTMQTDGNLVLTHKQVDGGVLWSTGTSGNNGAWAYMQPDGNLVVYKSGDPTDANALWSTKTWGNNGAFLRLQSDGNLALNKADGSSVLWSAGTIRLDAKLNSNTKIKSGQWIQSQTAVVEMQQDGNLVRYRRTDATPTWTTNTPGNKGAWAHVQTDGNFVLYKSDGNPATGTGILWGSNTWGNDGAFLKLQDNGSLVLYKKDAAETAANSIWSTGTFRPESKLAAGQQVYTTTTRLAMQWDGNLVLYRLSDNTTLWASGTYGNNNAYLKIQNDGNAIVYSSDGTRSLWATGTFWSAGAYLKLQDDGNLVVYKADGGEGIGNSIWSTNTHA
ncbi:trypsin-like serine protease [Kitasatospora sp. CB02891]|uniref:trypsin-like serine protease n=1 Tax=Kitasatospora sp. CB02891 TaxID=2020329 RepID=UPI0018E1EB5E|nr:trypsin-like serine protease [Kitasatospora sp. CB02891]